MKTFFEFTAWCFAVSLGFAIAACPPNPVTPPPDADAVAPLPPVPVEAAPPAPTPSPPASSCDSACAAMQLAGCVVLPDCAKTMCQANSDPKFKHYDVACLSRARTVADVRACGTDCSVEAGRP